ncbi:MAG: hypothetical protein AAEC86_08305, partial [Pseudohongiellaceae bacterium]
MDCKEIRDRICRWSTTMLLAVAFMPFVTAQSDRNVTAATVENWMTELSNWGRWGTGDQLGALNLITPAKRVEAAKLVKTGVSVSLAHNYSVNPDLGLPPPFDQEISMLNTPGEYVMERVSFSYHGGIHSHLDALCHVLWQGEMYNGFSKNDVNEDGCQKLGIANVKQGILTRGILMDIPRLKGVDYLPPGTAVYIEDLEA